MQNPYSLNAQSFFNQYQSLRFEDVHRQWLPYLPARPAIALDIGAGSGRDAAALARRGWNVFAVEPAAGLRPLGEQATQGLSVHWLDDRLPDLARLRALNQRFQLILVSAVWMHLPPEQRERAFGILTQLLAPGGILVVTLRHGPGDGERQFYEVNAQELERWARQLELESVYAGRDEDRLERDGVWWEVVVFRLPDPGAGYVSIALDQ